MYFALLSILLKFNLTFKSGGYRHSELGSNSKISDEAKKLRKEERERRKRNVEECEESVKKRTGIKEGKRKCR